MSHLLIGASWRRPPFRMLTRQQKPAGRRLHQELGPGAPPQLLRVTSYNLIDPILRLFLAAVKGSPSWPVELRPPWTAGRGGSTMTAEVTP